ncbi:hypothetical protein Ahy_B01g053198 isoform G [Arachis hypogaea]|uniref:Uncharacterized protein n=1 Tax=Arachis hypogaea TaxID=3818 RepID=A0A445ARA5_ARAHY|nr:hypothetical protein Ahy_B01g053198 isoform G [Arachis hypogaea]
MKKQEEQCNRKSKKGYIVIWTQEGATTTCYVALHPQVKGVSGKYLSDSNLSKITSHGTDANLVKKL